MYCKNCGAKNAEESRFCFSCGTELEKINVEETVITEEVEETEEKQEQGEDLYELPQEEPHIERIKRMLSSKLFFAIALLVSLFPIVNFTTTITDFIQSVANNGLDFEAGIGGATLSSGMLVAGFIVGGWLTYKAARSNKMNCAGIIVTRIISILSAVLAGVVAFVVAVICFAVFVIALFNGSGIFEVLQITGEELAVFEEFGIHASVVLFGIIGVCGTEISLVIGAALVLFAIFFSNALKGLIDTVEGKGERPIRKIVIIGCYAVGASFALVGWFTSMAFTVLGAAIFLSGLLFTKYNKELN